MKNLILLGIIMASVLFLDSCKKNETCVDGNGNVMQEQRVVDAFKDLTIDGAFKTTIYQTQNSTVDLFAESNIIPLITTDVNNQHLVITSSQCYNPTVPVEIYVNATDYETITSNGSGSVNTSTLSVDKLNYNLNGSGNLNGVFDLGSFKLDLTGSGNATLVGNATAGEITISGSGNTYASDFIQDSVYITVSGSGDAHIRANLFLDVTITGSGNVYYKGNPSDIIVNKTGTGELIDEN